MLTHAHLATAGSVGIEIVLSAAVWGSLSSRSGFFALQPMAPPQTQLCSCGHHLPLAASMPPKLAASTFRVQIARLEPSGDCALRIASDAFRAPPVLFGVQISSRPSGELLNTLESPHSRTSRHTASLCSPTRVSCLAGTASRRSAPRRAQGHP